MKTFIIVVAIAGAIIHPTTAVSSPSYGTHTKEMYEGMKVFCDQAKEDSRALNQPLTGALNDLCN